MQTQHDRNTILLRGELARPPACPTRATARPTIPSPPGAPAVRGGRRAQHLGPHALLEPLDLGEGETVEIAGEVRSFNNRSGQGSRLVISVLARCIQRSEEEPENRLALTGALCKLPVYRRTPWAGISVTCCWR